MKSGEPSEPVKADAPVQSWFCWARSSWGLDDDGASGGGGGGPGGFGPSSASDGGWFHLGDPVLFGPQCPTSRC